jgi:hypothetical protein
MRAGKGVTGIYSMLPSFYIFVNLIFLESVVYDISR